MSKHTQKHRFPNGFELVYQRSADAPVVALDLWVRAGSTDETAKEAGIAHTIEHMMFKGTKRRAPGELAREVENLGGEINAFTSFDYTVYTLAVAGRYTAKAFDLLHDALVHSVFDGGELEREKLVILEEIKRSRDLPGQYLSRMLFSTAYTVHPYKNPVIGSEKSVASFTREDLLGFVNRWYRPGNMALVGVGDRPFGEILKLTEKTFGQMGKKPVVRRAARPREGLKTGFTVKMEGRNVTEVYFDLAFRAPGASHPDVPALDLLSTVLGDGESSRLNEKVKLSKNLVRSVSAGVYIPSDPGLFYITGVVEPGRFEEAYTAVAEEIYSLVRNEVAGADLNRAREMVEADFVFQRETAQTRAQKLGYCHVVLNDLDHEVNYLDKLAAVKPRDLKRVAGKYLSPEAGVLCLIHPKGEKAPLGKKAAGSIISSAAAPLKRGAKKAGNGEPLRVVLESGARILIERNSSVPIVALRAAFLGGSKCDPSSRGGIFHLMGECLPRGTVSRSVYDIGREVDRLGGHLDGVTGRNSFGLRSEFLSKHLESALDLVADILANPLFDAEEVEKAREDTIAYIKRRDDNPAGAAFRAFERLLYGKHPYGRDIHGTLESVALPKASELSALYRAYANPENFTLALVGDLDPEEVAFWLKEKLRFPKGGGGVHKVCPAPLPPAKPSAKKIPSPFEQSHIVLGFLGASLYDADRLALKVANSMLSGQGGRLFTRLRDELALAYAVTSHSLEGVDRGYVAGYIATSPERAAEARDGLLSEFRKLAGGGFEPEEVEKAKRKLAGGYEMSLQENGYRTSQMALDELYGLDWRSYRGQAAKILKVTPEEVAKAAKKYLGQATFAEVIVGP